MNGEQARAGPSGEAAGLGSLARFLPYLRRYRGLLVLVVLLGAVSAALSKAAIPLVQPVVDVVLEGKPLEGGVTSRIPGLSEAIGPLRDAALRAIYGISPGETVGAEEKGAVLAAVAILGLAIAAAAAAAQYVFVVFSRRLGLGLVVDLRRDLCEHLLRLSLRFHARRRLGDLLSRITNDVQQALRAFTLLFDDIVQEPFMILASLAFMFFVSPTLTAALLLVVPAVAIPVLLLGRRVRKQTHRSLHALGETTDALAQALAGIRVVKAFGMERREVEEFGEANRRFLRRSMGVVRAKALTDGFTALLTGAGAVGLVTLLGWLHLRGMAFASTGDLMAFLLPLGTLYAHTKRVTKAYAVVMESVGAAGRVTELLDLAPEPPDPAGAVRVDGVREGVEVRDLRFAYDEDEVLAGVSFRARAGETVAIVGPSGAGKSTLVDLLAGFYEPTRGAILVDGVDLRGISKASWRARIALVGQDPFVFHDTIRENLTYGKRSASEGEIEAAVRAADLHGFVASLPEGMDTTVGEGGARLSGGQLQRLTIARALLRDPAVLLLDEATSSLDAESERAVQRALENLMRGRTTFVIAHRLSTVRRADQIVVLDRGRIVDRGTHAELLSRGGLYRRLYELQFRDEDGDGRPGASGAVGPVGSEEARPVAADAASPRAGA